MEFHEYPKHLTRGDDYRVVDDAAGEELARADGFRFWSDAEPVEAAAPAAEKSPAEPAKRGPGRPRKAD